MRVLISLLSSALLVMAAFLASAQDMPPLLTIIPDPITNRFNVSLEWLIVTNPIVAGYNIYLLLDDDTNPPTVYQKIICAGHTNNTCTFSNLPPGMDCDFAATDYSAAGAVSAFSPSLYYSTPNVPVPSFRLSANVPATNWIVQRNLGLNGSWASIPAAKWPLVISNNLMLAFYRLTTNWP